MNIDSTKAKKYQLNQVAHVNNEYSLEESKVMIMTISKIKEITQAIHQEFWQQASHCI
jgi:hypothetical protein